MARERAPEGPKALDRILGVRFRDASLRELALTHRSYAFEQELPANNERLEFLGDAVLGVVVTDMAFREFPEMPEGELAKLRAAIVNMSALADAARDLGLGRFILLGRGEEMSGGRDKSSILADALEAVLGAVYLDRGPPRGAQADRAGVPAPDDRVRPRRGRARLQDDPAGARLRRGALGARVPDPRTRARSSEGVHGHRVPRRQGVGERHRPLEEGGGAAGRARGLRPPVRARRAGGACRGVGGTAGTQEASAQARAAAPRKKGA